MRFQGLRVLVVEDDPDVRRYVVTLLTGQGCDVVAAPDGVTALAAIEAARPVGDFAVILLDRHLPDGDGLQFLRDIRRAGVQTPAIIATGYPDLDHAREAGALGAAAYHAKPLVGAALISALHNALFGRPQVAEPVAAAAVGGGGCWLRRSPPSRSVRRQSRRRRISCTPSPAQRPRRNCSLQISWVSPVASHS